MNLNEHITEHSNTQLNEHILCSCSFAKLTKRNYLFMFVHSLNGRTKTNFPSNGSLDIRFINSPCWNSSLDIRFSDGSIKGSKRAETKSQIKLYACLLVSVKVHATCEWNKIRVACGNSTSLLSAQGCQRFGVKENATWTRPGSQGLMFKYWDSVNTALYHLLVLWGVLDANTKTNASPIYC